MRCCLELGASTHNPANPAAVYVANARGSYGARKRRKERVSMWIGIAIVLLLLWAGGFFAFHVAGFFIHILLILAVVSFILHFVMGRRTAV
jgi:hypothetical protein